MLCCRGLFILWQLSHCRIAGNIAQGTLTSIGWKWHQKIRSEKASPLCRANNCGSTLRHISSFLKLSGCWTTSSHWPSWRFSSVSGQSCSLWVSLKCLIATLLLTPEGLRIHLPWNKFTGQSWIVEYSWKVFLRLGNAHLHVGPSLDNSQGGRLSAPK